jgi:probable F420-dependent oxidoreductase
MEFGIFYASAGPWVTAQGAVTLAESAEERGFDALWAIDHAVLPVDFAARYRDEGGSWEVADDYPIADPLVWLAFVAARTTRVRLATGVLVTSTRNPVGLAKAAASLAVLSEGRLMLGLGAGWLPEELRACGAPLDSPGARLAECVAVMRTLWHEPVASFAGRFTSFDDVVLSPKPPNGAVPIVLGGRTEAAARRAGRLADGFFPHHRDPDVLAPLFTTARAAAEAAGRDPGDLQLIAGGARSPQDLDRLARLGVSHVVLSPRVTSPAEAHEALDRYLAGVVRPWRSEN